jgi:hypothetical protein
MKKQLFLILFTVTMLFDLSAQIDKSLTNTLGNYNTEFVNLFTNELIKSYNNVKNSERTFQSVDEVINYLGVSRPTYITIDEYLINRPNDALVRTVFNLILNSNSIAEFRLGLRNIPLGNLTYNDKTFLAGMDYAVQFFGNTSITYVSRPGGNNVFKLMDAKILINGWKCFAAIAGGAIGGGLAGAGAGSVIPGVGTAAGGIIGAIGGGLVGLGSGACD